MSALAAMALVAVHVDVVRSAGVSIPHAESPRGEAGTSGAAGSSSDRPPLGNVAGNAAAPAFARGASNLPVAGAVPDAATLVLLLGAVSLPSILRPRRRSA